MWERVRSVCAGRAKWIAVCGLAVAVPLVCDASVSWSTHVFDDSATIPHRSVALVLGTSPTHEGRPNRFYVARMDAAAALFTAGAVDGILVSGDNGRPDYDESSRMRADLVARGVPAELITCDFAGFRTLDSVVRAKEVFGLDEVTIVSQPFHAERAVVLARSHGLDAIAFGAANPALGSWLKVRAREVVARTLAVADLAIGRRLHFLGPGVAVTTRTPRRG
ncbi:SanA/YdcF family protein [Engelhardtia mirabilis]|uniref:Vancomycin high temperature exclusion protein n=1 Tax=Engelhardtia mirabilis TaxID=2528011 RepID=A0A518BIK6_9BACT|nr:vancomycin high temperature exclusion protein [Planctomycetes bacterium Pla133]QDV01134.1 vancomycin high temperature exclusion protein [Planctomycetes bacterium Pla86]